VAVDSAGNLYIADTDNNRIRKVMAAGVISSVAGNGTSGYSGDGGSATAARLSYPQGVAVDSAGNLFIADTSNERIRKVTAAGVISTVAGNGISGFGGDGGVATSAQLNFPQGVAVDSAGNLFIADSSNNRIRRVTDVNFSDAKAQISSPAPGSTLTSSTVMFSWTAGTGVNQYHLSIGTTAGGTNIYSLNQGASLSVTVSGLPTNGSTLYVRLWSLIADGWGYSDYTYTATAIMKAQISSPAPGSTLTSSTVMFSWTAGTGVTQYHLSIGTTTGGTNIYSLNQGASQSVAVSGLPTNGGTLYVRLWSLIASNWDYNDYSYTASSTAGTKAQMVSPTPGSTLTSSTVTFTWDSGTNVSQYHLYIGTTAGGANIYSLNQGAGLSVTVSGLPANASTLYVRLWSLIAGNWGYNDYSYTASSTAGTKAQMVSPTPGSTLTSSTVTFTWDSGTNVSQYHLYIGTTMGGANIYSLNQGAGLSVTVSGLPANASTLYVRLWSLIAGSWDYNDFTYTASSVASMKAKIIGPTPGSTLTSALQWGSDQESSLR
jgi:hypothetical protein